MVSGLECARCGLDNFGIQPQPSLSRCETCDCYVKRPSLWQRIWKAVKG